MTKDPHILPMTTINRSRFSTTTLAMLDAIAHTGNMRIGPALAIGIKTLLAEDYTKAVQAGKRARRSTSASTHEYALSGARALCRAYLFIAARQQHITVTGKTDTDIATMSPSYRTTWKQHLTTLNQRRIQEPITKQKFGDITYYAGISEWEGWAYAPLYSYDVLHIRPYQVVDTAAWEAAFPGWTIKESPDGQISVLGPVGAPVKEVVVQWMSEHDIYHEGIREALNVRRRDLNELPPPFLQSLIKDITPYARGLVKGRHGSSMRRLSEDPDEIHSYITIWILELIQSFDASLGNPFGTWVTKQLPRKIHDLNRTLHGRTASDAEMFYARAVAEFQTTHGRNPTLTELAENMNVGIDVVKSHKRHMDGINSIRHASPLVRENDSESTTETIDVPATDEPLPEELAEEEERAYQITMAILAATGSGPTENGPGVLRKPLGFMVTYLLNYDDWVKGDLITLAGCRDRKVSDEVASVNKSLARNLSEYRRSQEPSEMS